MTAIRASRRVRGPVVTWDIENRPSAYWYPGATTAEITAIGWKLAGEEPQVMLLRRDGRFVADDGRAFAPRRAYERFRAVLASAGLVVGHNIRRHDLPIFQAGLLRHGLEPLPALLTSDTLRDYPRRKDMSASLENLAKLYGLDGEKKHMSVLDWEQANRLDQGGLELARERVVGDVVLQERLRDHLLSLGLLSGPKVWRG